MRFTGMLKPSKLLATEMDRTVGLLQAPLSELRNHKVLGIVGKVMLVLDSATDSIFIMKVLHKSSISTENRPSIVPSKIPYMVQLYKFIETDYAVFLVLQHATGGKLWSYIRSYLQTSPISPCQDIEAGEYMNLHVNQTPTNAGNVYSGKKLLCAEHSNSSDDNLKFGASNGDETNGAGSNCDEENGGVVVHKFPDWCIEKVDDKPEEIITADNSDSYVHLFTSYAASLPPDEVVGLAKCRIKHQLSYVANESNGECVARTNEDLLRVKKKDVADGFVANRMSSAISEQILPEDGLLDSSLEMKASAIILSSSEKGSSDVSRNSCSGDLLWSGNFSTNDLSHVTSLSDLEKIDAQDLITFSQRLLRNVNQTLKESNNSNFRLSGEHSNERLSECLDERSENEVTTIKNVQSNVPSHNSQQSAFPKSNSYLDNIVTSMHSSESMVKFNNEGASRLNSESMEGGRERKRSQRSIQRQFSDDSAFVSPAREARLSSSAGSLIETNKPRLRHLSAIFQQLDMAAGQNIRLPESCIKVWAAEIVIAVSRLHSLGIFCKDLSPSNVLLGERGHILLSFFSQWSCVDEVIDEEAIENLYAAPEVGGILPLTPACDWWSVGTLLFELLTGKTFVSCHPGGINTHTRLNIPNKVSTEAQSLLEQLLVYNPNERLGAQYDGVEAIKAHPFFASINWKELNS